MIALLLGILGLLINLFATVMLFNQITGLKVIPMLQDVSKDSHTPYDLYKDLAVTINDKIKDANEHNRIAHEKAIKWIILICFGTFIEIIALFCSYFQNLSF